ncbi:nucleotide pyrophosphatase [Niastella yeongjuensis]|uniref:Nucleotide pyrophosphatase n=2 Tax=Niastella yeongjuensis TaxID=354355 RepID=A0A1V9FCI6_9BACT|nr:nucleotide pyrophosphatase [Niastella yeongjuensis]
MIDGLGLDYISRSTMPTLQRWKQQGMYKTVQSVFPSVTNTNNASICCGTWPAEHGITGNSFLNLQTGQEEYMETTGLVLAPTIFNRAAKQGLSSALLSSKKKTIALLSSGADLTLTAEAPSQEWVDRLGTAPDIYSPDINYWLLKAGIWLLKNESRYQCVYIHTTDYPMHRWAPEDERSKAHLQTLDTLFQQLQDAAPDAAILLTADHGMNHKTQCWDLEKAMEKRGAPIKIAISAERDKYLKHHRGFGGTSYVYLNNTQDEEKVRGLIKQLQGVEKVLNRAEAATHFHTMPARIGDLVVLGDKNTVFGNLDVEREDLPAEYRTHGSLHEATIPLIVYNAKQVPKPDYFNYNMDLAKWLY